MRERLAPLPPPRKDPRRFSDVMAEAAAVTRISAERPFTRAGASRQGAGSGQGQISWRRSHVVTE